MYYKSSSNVDDITDSTSQSSDVIARFLMPQSPFMFLDDSASDTTLSSILDTWGLAGHILLPIYISDATEDTDWIRLVMYVMRMAKDYDVNIACIFVGENSGTEHEFLSAGLPAIRVLSNINDGIDMDGQVSVLFDSDGDVMGRHTHYILTKLNGMEFLKLLVRSLPTLPCILYRKSHSKIAIEKEFPLLAFNVDSLKADNCSDRTVALENSLMIFGKYSAKVRYEVGKLLGKGLRGLRRIGVVAAKSQEDQSCRLKRYFVYSKRSSALPKILARDLRDKIPLIIIDIANKSTNMSKLYELLDKLRKLTNSRVSDSYIRLLLIDPHALLFTKTRTKEDQKNSHSDDLCKVTSCVTSVKSLKYKEGIDMGAFPEDECPVETITVSSNEYIGTYHICIEGTNEKSIDEFIRTHSTQVIRVTFTTDNESCTISHKRRHKCQEKLIEIEKYVTKEPTYLGDMILACLKLGNIPDDVIPLVQSIEKWEVFDQLPSSLLMRIAPHMFNTQLSDMKNKRGKNWEVSAALVVLELIKVASEHNKQGVKEQVAEMISNYLKLETTDSANSFLQHPNANYVFAKEAKSIMGLATEEELLKHLDADRSSDSYCSLALVLCHLGRTTALLTLLKASKNRWLVSYILYSVGVLQYELQQPLGEGQAYKHADDHERFEECKTELEKLAEGIMHRAYTQDSTLSKILFESGPKYVEHSVIELAFMVQSKGFLCEDACKNLLFDRWWGKQDKPPSPSDIADKEESGSKASLDETKTTSKKVACRCKPLHVVPAVKFIFNAIAYFIFLVTYSISVLTVSYDQINILEYVVLGWMIILLIEEIRQVRSIFKRCGNISWWIKCKRYILDFWNIIDCLMFALYFVGFVLRLISYFTEYESLLTAAHLLLALDALVLYIRSLQFFAMHKEIGPLVIMVLYMCKDLIYFMLVLLIILLGYGVSSQAIIHPTSPLSWPLLYAIIQGPYEQIYGQLDAEAVMVATNSTGLETTKARNYCGLVLADLFVLFTNVLLLNLLIAMFNSSYNRVKGLSDFYNINYMYDILLEYETKSPVPPPFVVFVYGYELLDKAYSYLKPVKCCKTKVEDEKQSKSSDSLGTGKKGTDETDGDQSDNDSASAMSYSDSSDDHSLYSDSYVSSDSSSDESEEDNDPQAKLLRIIDECIKQHDANSQHKVGQTPKAINIDLSRDITKLKRDIQGFSSNLEKIKPLAATADKLKDEQGKLVNQFDNFKQEQQVIKDMLHKKHKQKQKHKEAKGRKEAMLDEIREIKQALKLPPRK